MRPRGVRLNRRRVFCGAIQSESPSWGNGLCRAKTLDSIEHPLCIVERRAAFNRVGHETTGSSDVAFVERLDALMKDRFRFALPFSLRAPRAFDVCAGSTVMTIEEQHSCPQVDRLLVLRREVLIEAGEQ